MARRLFPALFKKNKNQDSPAQSLIKRRTIRTSSEDWLPQILDCYAQKQVFEVIDDRNLGLQEQDLASGLHLLKIARKRDHLSFREIAQILAGLGLSGAGVWMIWLAVVDPDPTSKLWILLAGGFTLVLTGGLGTLKALGQTWRVGIRRGRSSIVVEPKD